MPSTLPHERRREHTVSAGQPGSLAALTPLQAAPVLKYLGGYPPHLLEQVLKLVAEGRLGQVIAQRYPDQHEVRTDKALYDRVMALKQKHLRNGEPISKVAYDTQLKVMAHALGTHTAISRVQGGKLKAKREIRVASLFKTAPPEFLQMIVVHELAHLKEREHNKAFYQLCVHMEPHYHQYEFDLRLYLTAQDLAAARPAGAGSKSG